jgi:hypothetical protein
MDTTVQVQADEGVVQYDRKAQVYDAETGKIKPLAKGTRQLISELEARVLLLEARVLKLESARKV